MAVHLFHTCKLCLPPELLSNTRTVIEPLTTPSTLRSTPPFSPALALVSQSKPPLTSTFSPSSPSSLQGLDKPGYMTTLWILEDHAGCKPTEEVRSEGRVGTGPWEGAAGQTRDSGSWLKGTTGRDGEKCVDSGDDQKVKRRSVCLAPYSFQSAFDSSVLRDLCPSTTHDNRYNYYFNVGAETEAKRGGGR